jgi:hypothetical protein
MRPIVVTLLAGCSFTPGVLVSIDATEVNVDTPSVPSCIDGMLNGDETDADCGGSCGPCELDHACNVSSDCRASVCDENVCRRPFSCAELHDEQAALADGPYSIDPDGANAKPPLTLYCDMSVDGGGWTLVGEVDGRFDMYSTWLISTVNANALQDLSIGTNSYACADAVDLAVNHSTEIRLSNSARNRWVKWPLPTGRTTATFWRHSVGQSTIDGATQAGVTVTAWDGATDACFQNMYGVLNLDVHGGSYPYAARNTAGNTSGGDLCMAVGTQLEGNSADGFAMNGNGFDAPASDATWPNNNFDVVPHLAVWLR